jgi:hypothetical protein
MTGCPLPYAQKLMVPYDAAVIAELSPHHCSHFAASMVRETQWPVSNRNCD